MAIYHLSVKNVSRNSGRSSVGAAAYRAGDKLKNERDGITHDYSKKLGIEHSEIMLPQNAPKEFQDRSNLWNAVEKSENRKDSRTAREIEVALPNELSRQEQIELVRKYVQENFVDKGMCADISIHAGHEHEKDQGEHAEHDKKIKPDNPHVHILLTTRPTTKQGFDKKKNREWDKRENVLEWRENWADICNREFEKKNLSERIDHRSLQEQGITDRRPTIHLGVAAHQMEQRGIKTEKGDFNREVRADNIVTNREFGEMQKNIDNLQQQQEALNQQLKAETENKATEEKRRDTSDGTEQKNHRGGSPSATASPIEPSTEERQKYLQEMGRNMGNCRSMYHMKSQYVDAHNELRAELAKAIRRLQVDVSDIGKYRETIVGNQQRIEQLQKERQSLGVFQGKEKRQLDKQIASLQVSQMQAKQSLQREHGITVEQAPEKIQAIREKKQNTENELKALSGDEKIKQAMDGMKLAEQEYKAYKIVADNLKLNYRDKQVLEKSEGENTKYPDGKRVKGTVEKYQRNIKLDIITPEEYRQIKDSLPHDVREQLEQRDQQGGKDIPKYAKDVGLPNEALMITR